ncbi:MAG: alpha-D-ribose 1-methylphosphonate 5-triphosphate diphosphatase, partial [Mangrovicoccus sp.]
HQVGYVVFNDHLPRKHLTEGRKPPRLTGQALKSRRSPEEHLALLSELHEKTRDPWGLVEDFARQLALKGVLMGSHDDPSPEIRAKYRTLGVHIAEFPMTEATALAAKEAGDPVILGAPNLVRGGSHNKNLDAKRAIDQGLCSALVSDYHYPALYQSAQKLSEHLRCDIAAAWGLVSHGAAQILGLADRGWLEIGKQADFIVTNQTGRIFASFVAGRPSFVASELVDSFL